MARVYVTDHKYDTGVDKAFVVENNYDADLLIYPTDNKYDADSYDEIWYFTDQKFDATFILYWTDSKYDADILVYKAEHKYDAKWQNSHHLRTRLS